MRNYVHGKQVGNSTTSVTKPYTSEFIIIIVYLEIAFTQLQRKPIPVSNCDEWNVYGKWKKSCINSSWVPLSHQCKRVTEG
ncbi:hypothetical protein Ocin01_16748 [Orchesella cincta]|uniref:Uncharacterized protein n=1 Tax=Orchesella cincta TaxID=48709 RepID=A0A1D2MAD3_ORCCI|nr:hypothetical protein Ocin01_16748 [Orchesella cincta]